MGYARVFWIMEEPIRRYIASNGQDDSLAEEIGRRILQLSARDSFKGHIEKDEPFPLFDTPFVFFSSQSFHSTHFAVLLWTGCKLSILPKVSPEMFQTLYHLVGVVGTSHVIPVMPKHERDKAIATRKWINPLESKQDIYASVYWIYEDFSREFEHISESDWPSKEVGVAILELMLSNWSRSAAIRHHGNAISRCCSFIRPEFAPIIWWGNCLQLLSELNNEDIEDICKHLACT